jgi:hypothetical protein
MAKLGPEAGSSTVSTASFQPFLDLDFVNTFNYLTTLGEELERHSSSCVPLDTAVLQPTCLSQGTTSRLQVQGNNAG